MTAKKALATARAPQQSRSRKTHDKILKATIRYLIKLGYAEISMQRIAEEADVSKGSVLQRFPTRTALIVSATEFCVVDLKKQASAKLTEEIRNGVLRDRIRYLVATLWKYAQKPAYSVIHQVWGAARTDKKLASALLPLSTNEVRRKDLERILPDCVDHPSMIYAHEVIISTVEALAFETGLRRDQQYHENVIEFLVDMAERELLLERK